MKKSNVRKTRAKQRTEEQKKVRRQRRTVRLKKLIDKRLVHWTNHIAYLKRTLIETQRELTASTTRIQELLKKMPVEEAVQASVEPKG
jgi:hypothetical protein